METDSRSTAEIRVLPLVALWKAEFARARTSDPAERELEFWRRTLADPDLAESARGVALDSIVEQAEKLEKTRGYPQAKLWYDRATGRCVDLKAASDEWLAAGRWETKTVIMHRQALKLLLAKHPTAESVNRKAAAKFVREILQPNRSAATVNRMLSTYSTFWRWMVDQGQLPATESNPWERQRLPTKGGKASVRDRRRPLTEDEGAALIRAIDQRADRFPADPLAVRILAVTGMRLGEVCGLRVQDVQLAQGGEALAWLHVTEGKRQASIRLVPVVATSVVEHITARLSALQVSGDSPVFPEYAPAGSRSWSAALSKRLARDLRGITKDPRVVAAHSWRHRARSLLERNGVRPAIADALLGHERPGVGMSVYYAPTAPELIDGVKPLTLPTDLTGEPTALA